MLILMHTQTSIEAGFPYGQDCNQNAISGGRLSPLGAVGRRLAKKNQFSSTCPRNPTGFQVNIKKGFLYGRVKLHPFVHPQSFYISNFKRVEKLHQSGFEIQITATLIFVRFV